MVNRIKQPEGCIGISEKCDSVAGKSLSSRYPEQLKWVFLATVVFLNLGCVSLGESENGFVIPDHMDSTTPKKRKIRKRIILS